MFSLMCNNLNEFIGLDSNPSFSFKINQSIIQKYYRIIVKDTNNIFWDSTYVFSSNNLNIRYEGLELKPRCKYYYKVFIKDDNDTIYESDYSFFETGKLSEKWLGNWISSSLTIKHNASVAAPYLFTDFKAKKKVENARLYICGLGYFEAYINDKKVSDDILSPAFTDYDKTVQYITYNVTDLIKNKNNELRILLGNGWYNCFVRDIWDITSTSWRHIPKMICELHIEYSDGSTSIVTSNNQWKSTKSPIIYNSIRNGEYYDANLENCEEIHDVYISRAPGGLITAMENQPIRVTQEIAPINFWKTELNTYVYDIGQNMTGFIELTAIGKKDDEIVIKYSERLKDDGINLDSIANSGMTKSGEFQTDKYIKKSDGVETFRPRFAYHGFQYVELINLSEEASIDTIKAIVIHTDFEMRGTFSCSDEMINKIHKNSYWSTISNWHSIPTDDPHREKNAWTGDSLLSAEQLLYNFMPVNELKKWARDMVDSQKPSGCIPCVVPSTGWGYNWGNGPDWSAIFTYIPWYLYLYYNDIPFMEEMYSSLKKHCDYIEGMSDNNLVCYGIGDWCVPFEGIAISISMGSFKTPTMLTDTAYFYQTSLILSKMAKVLDNEEDLKYYSELSTAIKNAFNKKYVNKEFLEGELACQTTTACVLFQDLAYDKEKKYLNDLLIAQIHAKNDHLNFGILGSKYVLNTLGKEGEIDLILKMVLQPDFPSYANWVLNGATTFWECWNGEGSRNHHMFTDIDAVFYKYLAGINYNEDSPGFKHIILQPGISTHVTYVDCEYNSANGLIKSSWKKYKGIFSYDIEIPNGSFATVKLPKEYYNSINKKYNPIIENKFVLFNLRHGIHKIDIKM